MQAQLLPESCSGSMTRGLWLVWRRFVCLAHRAQQTLPVKSASSLELSLLG